MDIDNLEVFSAVQSVYTHVFIAVKRNPAAAMNQKRKVYIIIIKIFIIEIC